MKLKKSKSEKLEGRIEKLESISDNESEVKVKKVLSGKDLRYALKKAIRKAEEAELELKLELLEFEKRKEVLKKVKEEYASRLQIEIVELDAKGKTTKRDAKIEKLTNTNSVLANELKTKLNIP